MRNLGCLLVVLGVGSFILPFFGLQFKIMRLFGDSPIMAIIMAVVGIVLLVLSSGQNKQMKK